MNPFVRVREHVNRNEINQRPASFSNVNPKQHSAPATFPRFRETVYRNEINQRPASYSNVNPQTYSQRPVFVSNSYPGSFYTPRPTVVVDSSGGWGNRVVYVNHSRTAGIVALALAILMIGLVLEAAIPPAGIILISIGMPLVALSLFLRAMRRLH